MGMGMAEVSRDGGQEGRRAGAPPPPGKHALYPTNTAPVWLVITSPTKHRLTVTTRGHRDYKSTCSQEEGSGHPPEA